MYKKTTLENKNCSYRSISEDKRVAPTRAAEEIESVPAALLLSLELDLPEFDDLPEPEEPEPELLNAFCAASADIGLP